MTTLIIVENPKLLQLDLPGAEVVPARQYLTDPRFIGMRRAKVFNLCRTFSYQSVGYYVSLLAAARGHRPLPSVNTMRDLRQSSVVRIVSGDVEDLIAKALAPIRSGRFTLSIYFGRNLTARYDRLCRALFEHFPAPLLRAEFVHADRWRLQSLRPIASNDIPEFHSAFVADQARRYFARPQRRGSAARRARYELAILVDPSEVDAPSNERAIQRFVRAALTVGIEASVVGREEYGRIAEYDALFIRATTSVEHFTYRFAQRAEAEGLVVIDAPDAIVRCCNKVYQAEAFERHDVAAARTLVVHRDNTADVGEILGYPCVLKQPDSAFSAGVVKARDPAELSAHLGRLLARSELVVAQEYTPSDFDWRIGILDGAPLYACRYYMARGHWQIQKAHGDHRRSYGKVETLAVEDAPPEVIALGVKAAGVFGLQGLFGVDIKELDGRYIVVEVNDNPSIDVGSEDTVLKGELYLAVMRSFYARIERRGEPRSGG